jgi:hypothetical protein
VPSNEGTYYIKAHEGMGMGAKRGDRNLTSVALTMTVQNPMLEFPAGAVFAFLNIEG